MSFQRYWLIVRNRIMIYNQMEKIGGIHRALIYLIPIVISFSSLVMGYFLVYFTMLEEQIGKYHQYTNDELEVYFTLTTALLPAGAILSAFFYQAFLETYGENKMLRYLDFLAIAAVSMQIISIYTPVLCVSRFLMGIYCGFTLGLVPSYTISISPSFKSGIIGSFSQIAMVLGMAFAYYMGDLLDTDSFESSTSIRILIGLPLVCTIVHLITVFMFPFDNIQRHIFRRDNMTVRKYMKMVYGSKWKAFEEEIRLHKIIPVEIEVEPTGEEEELPEPKCKKLNSTLMAIMLAVAAQGTGITAIQEYAKQLLLSLQHGNERAADTTIMLLGFFQVFATIIGGFLINRFGRRPLMLLGHGIVVFALFSEFACELLQTGQTVKVGLVFLLVFGFSISLGPLMMLYAVEALQSLQIVILVYWILMTLVTLASDFLIESADPSIMFIIFGVWSLLSFVYMFLKMVETKGSSRKQVREMIEGSKIEWEKSDIAYNQSMATKENQKIEGGLEKI